jgi:UDP-GlcNAc3NAcA epimerase
LTFGIVEIEKERRMHIVSIIGARPQFIKAAAVSRALRGCGIHEVLLHTGQHYDQSMSSVFFAELEIPEPKHNLGVRAGGHGAQTGRMLEGIEGVLIAEMPDWVLVYGDTNSTLAGALAAVKLHIPVAHVEAGLRSFNRRMPEEINRVVADHVSSLLFAPTDAAVRNLRTEGVPDAAIHRVGDVMYDAALFFARKAERASSVLATLGLAPGRYALATIHRAENTDDPARLGSVFAGIAAVAEHCPVVMPLHPRTRKALQSLPAEIAAAPGLTIVDPVGYLDMVTLEKNARLVITDSGGVQKEAFFYAVPCATLRTETEWTELIDAGWNTLVPPTGQNVGARLVACLEAPRPTTRPDLYGNGTTSEDIARILRAAG